MFLLGSRVPGRVLRPLSCRGRRGAGNWLQLALQVDAPVGKLAPVYSCVLIINTLLLDTSPTAFASFWVQEKTQPYQFSQRTPGSAGVGPIPVP